MMTTVTYLLTYLHADPHENVFEINLTECGVSVTEAGCLPFVTKMKLFLLNTAL